MQNSVNAKIFCLIHKMDLVPEDQREQVGEKDNEGLGDDHRIIAHSFFIKIFKQRENELKQISLPLKINCFRTSIWDETLYKVRRPINTAYVLTYSVLRHGHQSSIPSSPMSNCWNLTWINSAKYVRRMKLFCLKEPHFWSFLTLQKTNTKVSGH